MKNKNVLLFIREVHFFYTFLSQKNMNWGNFAFYYGENFLSCL